MNHRNEILNRTTKSHHSRSDKLNHLPAKLLVKKLTKKEKNVSHNKARYLSNYSDTCKAP